MKPYEFISFATVTDKPVRFYAPPSFPDLPWSVWTDLLALVGVPSAARSEIERSLDAKFVEHTEFVETDLGPLAIVPNIHARAMIDAAIEDGALPPSAEVEYINGLSTAMTFLSAEYDPADKLMFFADALARDEARGEPD